MKKTIILLLIFPLLFFCGFKKKEKPYVILSAAPVTQQSVNRAERVFSPGQRIYYSLLSENGFKYSGIRMQLSKQDGKTSNWGFSIIATNDIYVVKGDSEYRDYIILQMPGRYIIQFFYLNNKRYPFVHKEFMVL